MAIEDPAERADPERSEEEARWSAWMVGANRGDAEAYAKLLEEIGGVMEQYLRRRFGDSDFVEDCDEEGPQGGSEEPAAPTADPTVPLRAAEALRGLAPEYRDALLLTKFEGRSLEEAARQAGVSVTAMKSRVHRGIQQVRRLLAHEED
jgi:DNA-directed RNA polymerase specialized sigma24 family protein